MTPPGAPAGIWPVVRIYDAEEWGRGDYNLTVITHTNNGYIIYTIYLSFISLYLKFVSLNDDWYNYLYIYFIHIYTHIHSDQVIIAIIVHEKGTISDVCHMNQSHLTHCLN